MCGIAGYAARTPSALQHEHSLEGMLDALRHRGPDGTGTFFSSHVALGNVLLAIMDLGHGQQPKTQVWQQKTYTCVYNGEIYNYRELRRELGAEGIRFESQTDTEVVVAAYAVYGEQAVKRFDGQWALAIWCEEDKTLFLSRDPLGIKPLFYTETESGLVFASEPKGLFRHPDVACRPDSLAMAQYFSHGFSFAAGYSVCPRSFYEGVHHLTPGCNVLWGPSKGVQLKRYFNLVDAFGETTPSLDDIVAQTGREVERSIESTLMGDVPVGIALSGGLDSSIIAAVASDHWHRRTGNAMLASSIRYAGQSANPDAEHAALLARHLPGNRLDLVYSELSQDTFLSDVESMIWHFDEPHWEIKQLAMFNNYRKLRESGARVVLTGEGADELFFGYYHRFPGFQHPVIHDSNHLIELMNSRGPLVHRLFARPIDTQSICAESVETLAKPYFDAGLPPARCMQCWYLHTFLHWLLIDNDRCSMAHSLEGRFPYLNRGVLEVAFRTPHDLLIGDAYGMEKHTLRRAFSKHLPEAIWRKRAKAPLPSPSEEGFHKVVNAALKHKISTVDSGIWDVLLLTGARELLNCHGKALKRVGAAQHGAESELTQYLSLSDPWSVRTPHVFALLTMLIWWDQHFA